MCKNLFGTFDAKYPNKEVRMVSSTAIAFTAAIGGFLFGYDTAVVNGALFQLERDFHLGSNSWQSALVVSIAIVGAFVGSFASGFLASVAGRRVALGLADCLFILGSTILTFSPTVGVIFVGRLIVGFGIGIASVTVPIFLAEITPAQKRGQVVILNGVCICGAQFIAAVTCGLLVHFASVSIGWRVMFGLGAVPALVQLAAIIFVLPESPRWLQSKGYAKQADEVALACGLDVAAPLVAYSDSDTLLQVNGVDVGAVSLFSRSMRKRLLIGAALQAFQQFCGINTVMYYSANILKDVGFSGDEAPVLLSIPLAFINAVMTIAATFAVDKFGRRPLLLVSLAGCAFCTTAMVTVGCLQGGAISTHLGGWLFAALLGLYLVSFAPGIGAVPWVVMAEIFPTQLRSSACAVATMSNWLSNAIVSQVFPLLVGSIGIGPTFGIITGIELVAFVFVFFVVPETNQLTLEEIEQKLL